MPLERRRPPTRGTDGSTTAPRSPRPRRRRRGAKRGARVSTPASDRDPRPARSALEAAARRLGIERLHDEQQRVIAALLDGRDVVMILPTGFGKSACYQIPSLLLPKPVLVVSPLLALLRDQHEKLLRYGVPSVRLDGTIRGRERAGALARIRTGGGLLVLTTPESLQTDELRAALQHSGVALAAVDEAHCISEWGHDFRPSYLRLGICLATLDSPPLLALTATATPPVRTAIVQSLRMRDPVIVSSSPHRSNLAFEVLPCVGDDRVRAAVQLIRRLRRPGIVYCATTREVDLVHAVLGRIGVPAHRYHGAMAAPARTVEQTAYMKPNRRTVMVATSAFGLGIDKHDIRYVLHFQAPAALEQYVQEAGRAGRDGRKANCILLYDESDRAIHEALLTRSRIRPDQLYRLGKALAAWQQEQRRPTLEALAVSAELSPRVTSALLAPLEDAGLVAWDEGVLAISTANGTIETDTRNLGGRYARLRTEDGRRLDAIAAYSSTQQCRAAFLREYFGESAGASCGLCDVCTNRPARPRSFFAPLKQPTFPRHGRRRRRSRGGAPAHGAPHRAPPRRPAPPAGG